MNEEINKWFKEIELLRNLAVKVELLEEIKWGKLCYTYNNKNVVIIQPFRDYCSLGFFNGAMLSDKQHLLVKAGKHTQLGRQMRFKNYNEIVKLTAIIHLYLKEAIEIEKFGRKINTKNEKTEIHIEELEEMFKLDSIFKKSFEALTAGRQRGYLIYFSAAKQSETRKKRINKYSSQIKCGKGLNDCTCGLSKRMPNCDGSHKFIKIKVS